MKQQLFKKEFDKTFAWFTNEATSPGVIHLEIDLYKKLWNFFLAGDSYYFVLNHHSLQCDLVSNEVEAVFGCKPSAFDLFSMNDHVHQDDFPYFLDIGRNIQAFISQLPIEKLMKY